MSRLSRCQPSPHAEIPPAGQRALLSAEDVGAIDYANGLALQREAHEAVLADRDRPGAPLGRVLLLEHVPPVITVSRRPTARQHLLASPEQLARAGVTVAETDRGGDITYHGPGQLVAYPILDLNRLGLNLHAYLRCLEDAILATCAAFGVAGHRDACATGVWVGGQQTDQQLPPAAADAESCSPTTSRKIAAIGVRVRKWVSMHGLALNVATNLDHFRLIVPCGLSGREVSSLERELGVDRCPSMADVKAELARQLEARVRELVSRQPAASADQPPA